MKQLFQKTGLAWIWLAFVTLVLDQATKLAILAKFELHERLELIPFFNLFYARNYGAAFSFLADQAGWQRWFFAIIAITAVILLSYWLYKTPKEKTILSIGFSCVLGGALGNLYDRIAYGYVVDFIDFYIKDWHYPTFNIADMAIVAGAGLILLDSFLDKGDKADTNESAESNEKAK